MATAVIMPRQGQSVESCILTEWYRDVGDKVSPGDLLFAYETDKAAFEEEAREEGVLLARFYEAGEEVPVLVNVAVIGSEDEPVEEFRPSGAAISPVEPTDISMPESETRPDPGPGSSPGIISGNAKLPISPRAKKLAAEKRIVLQGIKGSGPGGRIVEKDIQAEIEQGKRLTPLARKKMEGEGWKVPPEGHRPYGKLTSKDLVEPAQMKQPDPNWTSAGNYQDIPLSNVRKIIAVAMHRSLQNSAQLTHHLGANATRMLQLRKEVKKMVSDGYPYNITLNDMVCYATIRALKKFPAVNAHLLEGKIRQFSQVNMGMAIDTERGLLVPAITGADSYSLTELSAQLKSMAEAAREGNISPDLLVPEAASFTISNLGNYGVEIFTPVINLPQVAILGVNTIIQRPTTLEDGSFGFQPFIGLSLTYDHRAIDGGPATQFLAEIKNQIEQLSSGLL